MVLAANIQTPVICIIIAGNNKSLKTERNSPTNTAGRNEFESKTEVELKFQIWLMLKLQFSIKR